MSEVLFLHVEDDALVRSAFRRMARAMKVAVIEAPDMRTALDHASTPFDGALVDVRLGAADNRDGLQVVRALRAARPTAYIAGVTGLDVSEIASGIRAVGADECFSKPVSEALLFNAVDAHRTRLREHRIAETLLGTSRAIVEVRRMVARAAASAHAVLITGESGTGKELVARALHTVGLREKQPFVAVNCAALPSTLVEAHLFGHERGSFTGATHAARGVLHAAGAGTLFLDEVGDLPLADQPKLLRVLEERAFQAIGSTSTSPFRARVVAATNVDLLAAVDAGRFRRDLFERLNVLRVHIPPLRERAGDVEVIALRFVNRDALTEAGWSWLRSRRWTGNVRSLVNALARMSVVAPGRTLDAAELATLFPDEVESAACETSEPPPGRDRHAQLAAALYDRGCRTAEDFERVREVFLRDALAKTNGNKSAAARELGMPRKQLERALRKKH